MRTESKTAVRNGIGRMIFVALSVIIQALWIANLIINLTKYSTWINLATSIVALFAVINLFSSQMNSAFKMPWLMIILAFPILGVSLYLLAGHSGVSRVVRKRFEAIDAELMPYLSQQDEVIQSLEEKDFAIANQARYIFQCAGYPIYRNTDVEFYSDAKAGFEAQKKAIREAESFIFMEYHAIEDAEAFGEIKEILEEKSKQGVDVRLFYDDIGSIGFINTDFVKRMEKVGIECRVFNPLVPVLNIFMNNRDHRKITVIDGRVGFTGGYNLANEYFNITHPYGYWKDTGVRLEGDAVKSLTIMFLEMWNASKKADNSYDAFLVDYDYTAVQQGYIQPYADSPLDNELTGENVYLNMIKNAKHYIYFMTPYLIISDEMNRELTLAAKRGVDVRIITPGIPDKKAIYKVTRSYYPGLVRDGVRIYEYTPGFCHAKQCVCDDEAATVGTINLDYRSLYHHFENGLFMYGCDAVYKVKQDFDDTLPVCREVTDKYKSGINSMLRLGQAILRIFAPLL